MSFIKGTLLPAFMVCLGSYCLWLAGVRAGQTNFQDTVCLWAPFVAWFLLRWAVRLEVRYGTDPRDIHNNARDPMKDQIEPDTWEAICASVGDNNPPNAAAAHLYTLAVAKSLGIPLAVQTVDPKSGYVENDSEEIAPAAVWCECNFRPSTEKDIERLRDARQALKEKGITFNSGRGNGVVVWDLDSSFRFRAEKPKT